MIGASRSWAPRSTRPGPNGIALLALEVLEVADHQDAVAGGDPEDGEEPDQRAERQHAVAEPYGEHSADERHRQQQERQQPPAAGCRTPPAAAGRSRARPRCPNRSSRSCAAFSSVDSPSTSAWYPGGNFTSSTRSSTSSTTEARSRPSTFAPTSIRRDCCSRSIVFGVGASRTSATSLEPDGVSVGRVDRQVLDVGRRCCAPTGCSTRARRRPGRRRRCR